MHLIFFVLAHVIMLEMSEHAYFCQGRGAINGKCGEFIVKKRKSRGLTLRWLTVKLEIIPACISYIEKAFNPEE